MSTGDMLASWEREIGFVRLVEERLGSLRASRAEAPTATAGERRRREIDRWVEGKRLARQLDECLAEARSRAALEGLTTEQARAEVAAYLARCGDEGPTHDPSVDGTRFGAALAAVRSLDSRLARVKVLRALARDAGAESAVGPLLRRAAADLLDAAERLREELDDA